MVQRIKAFLFKFKSWIASLGALAGGYYFAHQTWSYIHTLASDVLDESLYFHKGLLFALGKYQPFQDYGPLTNHMPLSFLIPGWVQQWFGAGLRTGRYYVFVLGLLMLIGYWLAAYRLGGLWWAAALVWVVALNKFWVELFSRGFVQGLVNVLLAWMLVFAFDRRGRWWQMAIAGVIGGFLVTTRVNLLPVLVLFVLYAFWQHNRAAGIAAALAGVISFGVVHLCYWPEILKLWAYWVPEGIIPQVDLYRSPWRQFEGVALDFLPQSGWLQNPQRLEWSSLRAFGRGVRFNFPAVYGVFAVILLWAKSKSRPSKYHLKSTIFLVTSFLILMGIHMWAALTARSCTFYCFENYIPFFMLLGMLAVVASADGWVKEMWFLGELFSIVLVAIFLAGVNYSASNNYTSFKRGLMRFLEDGLPWLRNWVGAADLPLWQVLQNKFGFDYYAFTQAYPTFQQYLPFAEVLLTVLVIAPILYVLLTKLGLHLDNYGRFIVVFGLVLGCVLAPTKRFSGKTDTLDCKTDVLTAYEEIGADLAGVIKPGSRVYWYVKSNTLLLYLPDVELFTPQLNLHFSKINQTGFSEKELDSMYRFGFWNDQLGERWKLQANYIVVEQRFYEAGNDGWKAAVLKGAYYVQHITEPVEVCRGDDSRLLVIKKVIKHGPD